MKMGLVVSSERNRDNDDSDFIASRNSWSRLFGKGAEDAKVQIIKDAPDVYFEVIDVFGHHGLIPMNCKLHRVRLFVDSNGFLCRIPKRE